LTFEWYVVARYYPLLLKGLLLTIKFASISVVTALLFGLLIAVLQSLRVPVLARLLDWYVVFFRETPLLVQLYFIYYALPSLGILLSAGLSGVLAITLNEGAFIAEIIRGGIQGVDSGQPEAARALAMTRLQAMRLVIMPQALRNVIPSLVGQSSYVLKDTSLLSVIAIPELLSQAGYINDKVLSPLTVFLAAAALYVLLFFILDTAGSVTEARLSIGEQKRWKF